MNAKRPSHWGVRAGQMTVGSLAETVGSQMHYTIVSDENEKERK